ncbi:hypothetical protein NC651_025549 [Populus alba x Populus x berolinensis]|nr:hypothetical protein NC651_025549 [Populus alba x Populus x berolinensis]
MALSFLRGNRPWEQFVLDERMTWSPFVFNIPLCRGWFGIGLSQAPWREPDAPCFKFHVKSGGSFAYEDFFTLLHCIDIKIRSADRRRPGIIFFCSALTEETAEIESGRPRQICRRALIGHPLLVYTLVDIQKATGMGMKAVYRYRMFIMVH